MFAAGGASGLLGIGAGALKVPALDVAMRLPLKVSSATTNFMIGVTAAASAGVYFARGEIEPLIAGPVCAGVLIGSYAGARYLPRARSASLRVALVAVVLLTAIGMFRKAFSWWTRGTRSSCKVRSPASSSGSASCSSPGRSSAPPW
jgi:uncharacterized membrane protein YfcA